MEEAQGLLAMSYDEALIILHYFKWSMEKIETSYFDNPEKYKIESGLKIENPIKTIKKSIQCPLCLENSISQENLFSSLDCEHSLCNKCWRDYINFQVIFNRITAFYIFNIRLLTTQYQRFGNAHLKNAH